MCGGEGTSTADEVAQATATAYALPVAQALGYCRRHCPDSAGCLTDRAIYLYEAQSWLEDFEDAVTATATCLQCEKFSESWETVSSDVIQAAHFSVDIPVCYESSLAYDSCCFIRAVLCFKCLFCCCLLAAPVQITQ